MTHCNGQGGARRRDSRLTPTPPLKEIDRPANLTTANAPGWGSDVIAERCATSTSRISRSIPGASYRGIHDSHRELSRQREAADAALPARGGRGRDRARLRQGHRQGDGGGGALQRRPVARHAWRCSTPGATACRC